MSTKLFDSVLPQLRAQTLIVPCISVGFTALNAVELLVNALQIPLHTSLYSSDLHPFARYSVSNTLETALDLYGPYDSTFFLVIRSPPIRGRNVAFVESLLDFIEKNSAKPIFLSSLDPSHRSVPTSTRSSMFMNITSSFDITSISAIPYHFDEFQELPGGGNTEKLLRYCTRKNLPALFLLVWSDNSNSFEDCCQLISLCCNVLGISISQNQLDQSESIVFVNNGKTLHKKELYLQ
ncbi:hypothetical protein RCL1_003149 [Eukaryota sp. TZLM3-RCL]